MQFTAKVAALVLMLSCSARSARHAEACYPPNHPCFCIWFWFVPQLSALFVLALLTMAIRQRLRHTACKNEGAYSRSSHCCLPHLFTWDISAGERG